MFLMSLHNEFVAWEGEAPAEPLHRWLGRSLALPKVFNGIDVAKMFTAAASPSRHEQSGRSAKQSVTNESEGKSAQSHSTFRRYPMATGQSLGCFHCSGFRRTICIRGIFVIPTANHGDER